MSQGPADTDEPVTVSNDGISVEKSVAADEFPVPAVKFVLSSNAAAPVQLRLTDQIPESFPMERVGFHPEYHSDSWTAYKNHRVEFEHELAPGESLTTVYGIRTDDESELQQFLSKPEITQIAQSDGDDPDLEGVLGPDNSQLIREVLSGERSSLPGSEAAPLDGPRDPSESNLSPEEAHTPPSENDEPAEPTTTESDETPDVAPETDATPESDETPDATPETDATPELDETPDATPETDATPQTADDAGGDTTPETTQ